MNLYSQLERDFTAARINRDQLALTTLGLLKSELVKVTKEPGGPREIDDAVFVKVARREIKRREEAAAAYQGAGRLESEAKEKQEADLLRSHLPPAMSEAELETEIAFIIAEVKPVGPAGFGQVMKVASTRLAGRAQGSEISAAARRLLGH